MDKISSLFKDIGFEGVFEIEFLRDKEGNLYFGEINFRNSTWSYASTCAGMNLPMIWASLMIEGGDPQRFLERVPEGFTAMVEPDDVKCRKEMSYGTLWDWFLDFLRADCRFYLGKHHDFGPIFELVKRKLKSGNREGH